MYKLKYKIWIDQDGKAFGEMIIQLPDDSKGSVRAFEYLKRSGFDYAEI